MRPNKAEQREMRAEFVESLEFPKSIKVQMAETTLKAAQIRQSLESTKKRLKNERTRSKILAQELKKADIAIEQLLEIAHKDELTGLPDRRGIKETYEKIKRLNLPACVMLFDADDFKSVNERYKYATGDRALIAITERLKNLAREHDIVGRWGGEEFLIIFLNTTAQEIYDRFKKDTEGRKKKFSNVEPINYVDDQGEIHEITLSAGIAKLKLGEELKKIIAQANTALKTAKLKGKNQFILFNQNEPQRLQNIA